MSKNHKNIFPKEDAMIYRSETIGILIKSLSLVQIRMKPVIKEASNPFFKSTYAPIECLMKVAQPALEENGLGITQIPGYENGERLLKTILAHECNEWIMGVDLIKPPKEDIQSYGSYLSYLRRYSYAAILGIIIVGEDDDGEQDRKSREYKTVHNTLITPEQEKVLLNEIGDEKTIYNGILTHYKISRLSELKKQNFEYVLNETKRIKKEQGL